MNDRPWFVGCLVVLCLPALAPAGLPLPTTPPGQSAAVDAAPGRFEVLLDFDKYLDLKHPVTAGDPEMLPNLWQRTWGVAGFSLYPQGDKMAPNGVPYDPLFSLDLLLNVSLTTDRSVYLFCLSRFWGQKAGEGITNQSQGKFDFSKRQFDLDGGVAWNYAGRLEARAFGYSFNNLNRGEQLGKPLGFKDGFAVENRYYFASTDFDRGLYRFLTAGYYFTKDLVGADGTPFQPGLFIGGDLAVDVLPYRLYGYGNTRLIFDKDLQGKLLLLDSGIAFRPCESARDLEFRVGADVNVDLELHYTRALLYAQVRIVW